MSGLYTNNMPNIANGSLTGNEQIPLDTILGQGLAPESAFMTSSQFNLGPNQTALATTGAATLNAAKGKITSEALTTAAGSDYVLTLTDSAITAVSNVQCSCANGTNTTEGMAINRVQASAGQLLVHVRNTHASAAWNGTIVISFVAW